MNEEDLLNQEDESLNISEQETEKKDIQESESIFFQNTSQEEILSPTLLALPSRRRRTHLSLTAM